jgi:hypothetical protein
MTTSKKKSQLDRFKKAAHELGEDDDKEAFSAKLRKLVNQKPDER